MSATPAPAPAPEASFVRSAKAVLSNIKAVGVIGTCAILAVWAMELWSGAISPWDRWALPLVATVVGSAVLCVHFRPACEPYARLSSVLAFNTYLVVVLHANLYFTQGGGQWYQTISTLYWTPLAYASAFVFLPARPAVLSSLATIVGIFGPLMYWAAVDRLPTWTYADGPLLPVIAVANGMCVVLLSAVAKLRSSHEEAERRATLMHDLARTDALTGLPNRRAMLEELDAARAQARRAHWPFCVGIIDIDHFKAINDTHGHAVGDQVLAAVAHQLRQCVRASDRVARWGGEEFIFCANGTPISGAHILAERIRQACAQDTDVGGIRVTVSLGLAEWQTDEPADALLRRADQALYAAKAAGRDQIVVADQANASIDGGRP